MAHVTWVVETGIEPAYEKVLLKSIQKTGSKAFVRKVLPFGEGMLDPPDLSGHVVFHGSLQGAQWVREHTDWKPGAIENTSQLECRYYYPRLGPRLLNREHTFLPFGCLEERKDDLFRWLGEADCIFLRPDSNRKPFSGQIIRKEQWNEDIGLASFYGVDPEVMVVVARPQVVRAEWRFFVCRGQVVTGSCYRRGDQRVRKRADEKRMDVARNMLAFALSQGYDPDPVWVLDICEDGAGEYRILEVGGFSSAGLYACNTHLLVQAVEVAVTQP
jgi:hypothetical protein